MGNSNTSLKERYIHVSQRSQQSLGVIVPDCTAQAPSTRPPGDGFASVKSGPHTPGRQRAPTMTHMGAQLPCEGPGRRAGQRPRRAGSGLKHPNPAGSLHTPDQRPHPRLPRPHLELLLLGHCHGHVSQEERVSLLPDLVSVVLYAKPAQVVLLLCSRRGERTEVRTFLRVTGRTPSQASFPAAGLPSRACTHHKRGTHATPRFIS